MNNLYNIAYLDNIMGRPKEVKKMLLQALEGKEKT
jgi:hypothetical protein